MIATKMLILCLHWFIFFVSENGIRIFKDFNPVSRDEFETVWDRIGVQMITDWSTDGGPRCKTTSKNAFLLYCLFAIYLQNGKIMVLHLV